MKTHVSRGHNQGGALSIRIELLLPRPFFFKNIELLYRFAPGHQLYGVQMRPSARPWMR